MFINSTRKKPCQNRYSASSIKLSYLLLIISISYIVTCQDSILAQPTTIPVSKLRYFSDTFGVSIDYPGEWMFEEHQALGTNITIVKFSSCHDKRVNVALTFHNFSENVTLEQYTNYKINSVSSLPSSMLSTKEIIEHKDTWINTYPGYQLIIKSNLPLFWNVFSTISTYYWTIMNNSVYGIVYNAPEDQHAVYLPVVKEMVDSFQIVKTTGKNSRGVLDMVSSNTAYDNSSVMPFPVLC